MAHEYNSQYSAPYTKIEAIRRMIAACNRHRWHIAQSLLDVYGSQLVDVRGIGNYDCTPLHAAAAAGQTDLLMTLLDHGAEVDAPAMHGFTPLYLAVRNNRANSVRMLLHAGADPDLACNGFTALMTAVEKGYANIVSSLLDSGASTNISDVGGDEPIHIAARHGYYDIAQSLIDSGANVYAIGSRGLNAIQVAEEAGHYDLAEYIRTGDARIGRDRADGYGRLIPYNDDRYGSRYDYHGNSRSRDLYRAAYPSYTNTRDMYYDGNAYNNYRYGLSPLNQTVDALDLYDPHTSGYGYNNNMYSRYPYNNYTNYSGQGIYGHEYNNYYNMGNYYRRYGRYGYGHNNRYPYSSYYNEYSPYSYRRNYSRGLIAPNYGPYPDYNGYGGYDGYDGYDGAYGGYGGYDSHGGYGPNGGYDSHGGYGPNGGYDTYGGYGGYGDHGYGGQYGFYGNRRSQQVAMLVNDFIGHGMRHSEKRRFLRRIERNARLNGITPNSIYYGRHDSESLARMLVTDTGGYCRHDDLYAMVHFLRSMRRSAVLNYY